MVLGGFILDDEGYRYSEVTNRKRFNFNTRFKDQKVEGLSYGLNANFLYNETASALIWQSYDEAYIPLDSSVSDQFEKKLRHKNFIFSNSIDLIHEFFNFERKLKSNILSKSVKALGKNPSVNKLFTKIADRGVLF